MAARAPGADGRPPVSALVLSGGGADGAYEVGVLKALLTGASWVTDYRPLEPEVFTGTSIGSFNAAFLVARWAERGPEAVFDLERVWLERLASDSPSCGNGIFRFRTDPLAFANPRCYTPNPLRPLLDLARDGAALGWDGLQRLVNFIAEDEPLETRLLDFFNLSSFVSREPWQRTLVEEIDYAAIRVSPKKLRIATTNWATGELKIYQNFEMSERLGPLSILASSAVPGFFEPASVGAMPFVDGGVLLNTPLRPAIAAGADVIHMIYLDPDIKNLPINTLSNTVDTFYRMQQIRWAAAVNDDISDAENINKGLALLANLEGKGQATDADVQVFLRVADRIRQRQASASPYRPLTIYRYHPHESLGSTLGFLDLQRERIEYLIEAGFQDAVHHDCDAADDVLPFPRERRRATT